MNAIIVTGGKQYKVAEGDTLFIEKLNAEAGEAVTFDKVLAVLGEDKATFGAPVVEGAKVSAMADGTVINCADSGVFGAYAEIDHGGVLVLSLIHISEPTRH